jgi:cytochrome c oxidase assembly factor 6
MVFGFGFSSSSSSSSKPADGAPPTRQERQRCWTTRDAYYACLDKHDIMSAGEGDGAGAALGDKEGVCADFRKAYESSCGKSWVSACLWERGCRRR